MVAFGEVALVNAVVASVLAIVAWNVGRRVQRPAVQHALWLLVLVKLVTPPLFVVKLLPPAPDPAAALSALDRFDGEEEALGALPRAGARSPSPVAPRAVPGVLAPTGVDPTTGLLAGGPPMDTWRIAAAASEAVGLISIAGALFILALGAVRAVRFRRRLRGAVDAPADLIARARSVASRLELKRLPAIRVTDEPVPPFVWPAPGGCEIVVPRDLLSRLTAPERDALLAHELAHVRRRDHWIRPLELLVVALYWWHPVVRWARRHLRAAEEKCCDDLVLDALPGRPRSYAESLLKTLEFLNPGTSPVPRLATGAADPTHLKERVTMIMREDRPAPLSARVRLPMLAAALLTMLVSPSWAPRERALAATTSASRAPAPPAVPPAPGASSPDAPMPDDGRQEMIEFRRQELALEKQLFELRARQMEVEEKMQGAMLEIETRRLQAEIERFSRENLLEEAAAARQELSDLKRRVELDQRHAMIERELATRHEKAALEMRTVQLELDSLGSEAREEREKLEAQREALDRQMREMQVDQMQAQLEAQKAQLLLEEGALAQEMARLKKQREEDSK